MNYTPPAHHNQEIFELRALGDTVLHGFYDDHMAAMATIDELATRHIRVYSNVNHIDINRVHVDNKLHPGSGATTASIVTRRVTLPLDIDATRERATDTNATDTQHEHAIELARVIFATLRAEGFPAPLAMSSGNGATLLYPIDEPTQDDGLVKRVLQGLAQRFDTEHAHIDLSVHDPPRIIKVAGSFAGKEKHTPERPSRKAIVMHYPPEGGEPTPTSILERIAVPVPKRPPPRNYDENRAFDMPDFLAGVGLTPTKEKPFEGGTLYEFDVCPWNSDHDNGSFHVTIWPDGRKSARCFHNGCADRDWFDLRAATNLRERIRRI